MAAGLQRSDFYQERIANASASPHHETTPVAGATRARLPVWVHLERMGGEPAELDAFLAPDATNIQQQQLGPGLDSLTYSYSSSVTAQSARIHRALAGAGWQFEDEDIDCGGPCLLGGIVFVYRRQFFFNRISEVATIEQEGAGPYRVRVVMRRCVRLPGLRCWPPA